MRIAFYRTVAALMRDHFTGQVADWCHRHRVRYSGHYHSEENLYFHVGNYGDFLQVLGQADWPGFDMLCASHTSFWHKGEGVNTGATFMSGKYVSSVSRIKGGNTTMVEVCPVMHEEEMKPDIADAFMGLSTDCAFIGATHFNNYGYHFLQDPQVFQRWNRYTGRLCYMLRGARSDAQIGLFYPITDAQAAMYEPSPAMDALSSEELALNNYLENTVYNLLINRLDFNFLTEESILGAAMHGGALQVGGVGYRVVLMPRVSVVPLAVMEKLRDFREKGGTVLWLDSLPRMGVTEAEHGPVRQIAACMADGLVSFRPDNLALHAAVTASSTDEADGYRADYVTNGSIETDFAWEGWSSGRLPASLEIELPEETTVNRLDVYSKKDYVQGGFRAYWLNGAEWIPLAEVSDNTREHCWREFPAVRAKRFRLVMDGGSQKCPDIARITEIQLYHVRYQPGPEDLMCRLHEILNTTLAVEQEEPGAIFVSRYRRGAQRFYYIINRSTREQPVTLREDGCRCCRLYQPLDGRITEVPGETALRLGPGRGIFLEIC